MTPPRLASAGIALCDPRLKQGKFLEGEAPRITRSRSIGTVVGRLGIARRHTAAVDALEQRIFSLLDGVGVSGLHVRRTDVMAPIVELRVARAAALDENGVNVGSKAHRTGETAV